MGKIELQHDTFPSLSIWQAPINQTESLEISYAQWLPLKWCPKD